MSKNVKIKINKGADKLIEQLALEKMQQDGIDITCPQCGKKIHISHSGDACKFCGLIVNLSADTNI